MRLRFSFKAYRRPFRVPVRTSRRSWEQREGILIRLEDIDGRVGLGEIAPIEWFGTETFVGALAWCESLGPEIDADQLREPVAGKPCCSAAIGAARAGLEGAGQPPTGAKRLPVASLLPPGWPALDALARTSELGFTVFKLKIGVGDRDAEFALIDKLVDRLPERGRLRLDANGGLDARAAAEWLEAAEDWPVEFIEQPLGVDAWRDHVRLAQDHRVAVALDESVMTADDIKRWRDRDWPGLFVIKPALSGPLHDLVAEIATLPGQFIFSSALETDVGLEAGTRLALSLGIERALGYGTAAYFAEDGLGGSLAMPWFGPVELAQLKPESAWKRL